MLDLFPLIVRFFAGFEVESGFYLFSQRLEDTFAVRDAPQIDIPQIYSP